jgi:ParB family chromosome partitioning protein
VADRELRVDSIRPSPFQPRTEFDLEGLQELAASIRRHGVLEPILVRPMPLCTCPPPLPAEFELVMGERRLRAARLAGCLTIPAEVRELTDEQAAELALIENIQRRDLTPLEEARAYQALMDRLGLTRLQLAARLGKTFNAVEYKLRLLNLRPEYQEALAKRILTLPQACDLARVPPEQQRRIFQAYRKGMNANRVARLITALREVNAQEALPGSEALAEAGRVARRFEKVLRRIAADLGRCYSREDLALLGWVTDGSVQTNLELVALLVKQLRQIEDQLRQAHARQDLKRKRA